MITIYNAENCEYAKIPPRGTFLRKIQILGWFFTKMLIFGQKSGFFEKMLILLYKHSYKKLYIKKVPPRGTFWREIQIFGLFLPNLDSAPSKTP